MEIPKQNQDYKIRAMKLKIEELYEDIYKIKSEKIKLWFEILIFDKQKSLSTSTDGNPRRINCFQLSHFQK